MSISFYFSYCGNITNIQKYSKLVSNLNTGTSTYFFKNISNFYQLKKALTYTVELDPESSEQSDADPKYIVPDSQHWVYWMGT